MSIEIDQEFAEAQWRAWQEQAKELEAENERIKQKLKRMTWLKNEYKKRYENEVADKVRKLFQDTLKQAKPAT